MYSEINSTHGHIGLAIIYEIYSSGWQITALYIDSLQIYQKIDLKFKFVYKTMICLK